MACRRAVDFHVHFHFLHFAKLFHGPLPPPGVPALCRLHLQVIPWMKSLCYKPCLMPL